MDRRTLLVAGGAIAVAGLTGAPARAAGRRPIFEWARPGGFFFPGEGVLSPPPLAVYDDNTAYADAAAGLRLRPRQVEALRVQAVEALSGLRDPAREPGRPAREHPVDLVSVRTDDGAHLTTRIDPGLALPEAVRALDDTVQGLRRTVLDGGEPWRPNAILLATVRLDDVPDSSQPWPDGLPRPDTDARYAEQFPRGRQAQLARRALPSGRELWPAYRTTGPGPAGEDDPRPEFPVAFVRATWRHLLPHEL